jgi:exonuclease SbcD
MTIVMTAGNHDSNSKLEIDRNLWNILGVHVIGNIERTADSIDFQKHIIKITDATDNIIGYIAAVPHVYPQNFPLLDNEAPREERQSIFFQTLLDEVQKINTAQAPVVLMAHLAVTGSDTTGHDESIGGMDSVCINTLGSGYDYLALGHIHCPQNIGGGQFLARYSGSPVPVNFDETYPHSITIAEISDKAEIRTVEIKNHIPLVTLPKNPVPFDDALKILEEFPSDKQAYIRLNVLINGFLPPDCNEKISLAIKDKKCRFCYIKSTKKTSEKTKQADSLSIHEIRSMSPLDIAQLYFKESEGMEMDDELCGLMNSALERIQTKQTSDL